MLLKRINILWLTAIFAIAIAFTGIIAIFQLTGPISVNLPAKQSVAPLPQAPSYDAPLPERFIMDLAGGWAITGGPGGNGRCKWKLKDPSDDTQITDVIACTYAALDASLRKHLAGHASDEEMSGLLNRAIEHINLPPPPAMP